MRRAWEPKVADHLVAETWFGMECHRAGTVTRPYDKGLHYIELSEYFRI